MSKYVPDEVLPLIGEFFPRFHLVDIEAGHWLISEQPEAFRQGEWSQLLARRPSSQVRVLTPDSHCRVSATSGVKSMTC